MPYAAVRARTSAERFAETVHESWPVVFGHLDTHGIERVGAPFIRYLQAEDDGDLEVEFGAPVAVARSDAGRIRYGELPAGRYATLMHRGPYAGLTANHAALKAWAAREGLSLDARCIEHYLDKGGEQRVELAYLITAGSGT